MSQSKSVTKKIAALAAAASAAAAARAGEEAGQSAARIEIVREFGKGSEASRDALDADWAQRANPFLKAIADPTRARIILLLKLGAMDVTTITRRLGGIRQASVSEQLAKLKKANIVYSVRMGQQMEYRLVEDYFHWKFKDIVKKLG